MYFEKILASVIIPEELAVLRSDAEVYVDIPNRDFEALTPALIKGRTGENEPRYHYQTIFGSSGSIAPEHIWVADENGEERPVERVAGTRLSLSLFFPGMDQEGIQELLYQALRGAFGPGVVDIWNERWAPVSAVKYDVYRRDTEFTTDGRQDSLRPVASDMYHEETRRYMSILPNGTCVVAYRPEQPEHVRRTL